MTSNTATLTVAATATPTGSMAMAHVYHTATLLPGGKVLVTGGGQYSNAIAGCEVYDVATGTWATTGSMGDARNNHTATLLPSGKVLVTGGGRTRRLSRPAPSSTIRRQGSGRRPAPCAMRAAITPRPCSRMARFW